MRLAFTGACLALVIFISGTGYSTAQSSDIDDSSASRTDAESNVADFFGSVVSMAGDGRPAEYLTYVSVSELSTPPPSPLTEGAKELVNDGTARRYLREKGSGHKRGSEGGRGGQGRGGSAGSGGTVQQPIPAGEPGSIMQEGSHMADDGAAVLENVVGTLQKTGKMSQHAGELRPAREQLH
jgi:hypothetical protein